MTPQSVDGPDEEQEGGERGEKEWIVLHDLVFEAMEERLNPLRKGGHSKRDELDHRQQSAGDKADRCRSFSPSGEHQSLAASLPRWIRSETHSLRCCGLDGLVRSGESGRLPP